MDFSQRGKITEFSISNGDLPIINYKYSEGKLQGYNRINGSRDGGMNFPAGFFEVTEIQLNEKQHTKLFTLFNSLRFNEWKTDYEHLNRIDYTGYCISDSFSCKFDDGKEFVCYPLNPKPQGFDELFSLLKSFCLPPVLSNEKSKNLEDRVVTCVLSEKYDELSRSSAFKMNPNDMIGKMIGDRYELLKLIGKGGTFNVYFAIDKRLNKQWAVKILRNNLYNASIAMGLAIQEAEMLKTLNHPAIPRMVDVIDNQQYFAVVQDYIEGDTLKNIVNNCGAQPAEQVIDWAKQVCDVLSYLHSLNPPHIYRDMKPGNLILEPTGNIKVIDFGIMRTYKMHSLCDTTLLGTRGYAAPEQFSGVHQSDARTDIFGLGMTMHHLVTGVDPNMPPYETNPIRQINSELPRGLEYIISKCTKLDPDQRYQTCSALKADLINYQNLPPLKGLFSNLFGKKKA